MKKITGEKATQKLFTAVEQGDIEIARRAIQLGAKINERNGFGHTPLTFAAAAKRLSVEMLLLLHQNGADVNNQDNNGRTALMLAAGGGCLNATMLKLFHGFGADVNARDSLGQTVIQYAAMKKETFTPEILRMLHKYGVSMCCEGKPEWDALNIGSVSESLTPLNVRCLVEFGGNINVRDCKTVVTPLIRLAMYANTMDFNELFPVMTELGADVNARDNQGNTAFLQIMKRGMLSAHIIRMFNKNGADITVRDESGNNAMAMVLFNMAWNFFTNQITSLNALFDLGFSIQDMYPRWTVGNFKKRILNSTMSKAEICGMALFFALKLGPKNSQGLLSIVELNRSAALQKIISLPRNIQGIQGLEEELLKTLLSTKGEKILLDSNMISISDHENFVASLLSIMNSNPGLVVDFMTKCLSPKQFTMWTKIKCMGTEELIARAVPYLNDMKNDNKPSETGLSDIILF